MRISAPAASGSFVHAVDLVEGDVDDGRAGVEHRALGVGPEPERRTVQRELDVLDGTVVGLVRLVLHEAERLDEEAGTSVEIAVVDDGVDRGGHACSSLRRLDLRRARPILCSRPEPAGARGAWMTEPSRLMSTESARRVGRAMLAAWTRPSS